MSEINMLNVITINFNTRDTQENDKDNKFSTNTAICLDSRHGQNYTNIMQEADRAKKYCVNTDSISK